MKKITFQIAENNESLMASYEDYKYALQALDMKYARVSMVIFFLTLGLAVFFGEYLDSEYFTLEAWHLITYLVVVFGAPTLIVRHKEKELQGKYTDLMEDEFFRYLIAENKKGRRQKIDYYLFVLRRMDGEGLKEYTIKTHSEEVTLTRGQVEAKTMNVLTPLQKIIFDFQELDVKEMSDEEIGWASGTANNFQLDAQMELRKRSYQNEGDKKK